MKESPFRKRKLVSVAILLLLLLLITWHLLVPFLMGMGLLAMITTVGFLEVGISSVIVLSIAILLTFILGSIGIMVISAFSIIGVFFAILFFPILFPLLIPLLIVIGIISLFRCN